MVKIKKNNNNNINIITYNQMVKVREFKRKLKHTHYF